MTSSHLNVRVRFAPSPTGHLHVGGVRTALFNWLYAKRFGGKFLLRIEDTDLERSKTEYTDDILMCLKWLGMNPEEEVLYQSKRLSHYVLKANELIAKGLAYKCFSTEVEIDAMRVKATAEGKKPMYDRTWRDRSASEHPTDGRPFVVRAKLPLDGTVAFMDLIHGETTFKNEELDDFVIIRSNGAPTYNFSVVIDDGEMKISHVIRGDDHINNTPKQVHLYHSLGLAVPKFAHLPMILGEDKKKLSKRNGDVSANNYLSLGYLPEALLNFMVRLGWSHGDQEIFSIKEMTEFFDFDHVVKSPAVFNTEKLGWINNQHLKMTDPKRICALLIQDFGSAFSESGKKRMGSEFGEKLVKLTSEKVQTLKEFSELLSTLANEELPKADASSLKWNKDLAAKEKTKGIILEVLGAFFQKFEKTKMDAKEIEFYFHDSIEKSGVKMGEFMQPMRLALTGKMGGIGLYDYIAMLSLAELKARLLQIESF